LIFNKALESEQTLTYNLFPTVFERYLNMGFVNKLNQKLSFQYKGYKQALYQSYMTTPEWRNVEMAEEFSTFLKEGNGFYQYPYFRQIKDFWYIFAQSYSTAKRYHTHIQLITSEYMLMNLFIGIFTTVSFTAKGLLSLLIAPFLNKKNTSPLQEHVANIVTTYANFIHHTPFYNFPYFSKIKPLIHAFKQTPQKSITDIITFLTTLTELCLRGIISWPVAYWYNQPENQAAEQTHLLVKTVEEQLNYNHINQAINIQGTHIYLTKTGRMCYQHITMPRYEQFTKISQQLVENDIEIVKIAGQDQIQFKVEVDNPKQAQKELSQMNMLYAYGNHLSEKQECLLNVKTKDFNDTVTNLK